MVRRHRGGRGLALVEFVIAAFILESVVIAVMSVWPLSMSSVQQGKEYLVAANLAKQAMETSLASGFTALQAQADQSATAGPGTVLNSLNNGMTQTQIFNSTVQVYSVSGNSKLLDVVVTVSWQKGGTTGGITRTVKYESNLASTM